MQVFEEMEQESGSDSSFCIQLWDPVRPSSGQDPAVYASGRGSTRQITLLDADGRRSNLLEAASSLFLPPDQTLLPLSFFQSRERAPGIHQMAIHVRLQINNACHCNPQRQQAHAKLACAGKWPHGRPTQVPVVTLYRCWSTVQRKAGARLVRFHADAEGE